MKKIFTVIGLLSLILVFSAPIVEAASQTVVPSGCTISNTNLQRIDNMLAGNCSTTVLAGGGNFCDFSAEICGMCCVLNTIFNITDWIFIFLVVLAAVFIILGAYFFMTSAGDPEKTKTGRNYILYAAVGLAVAFLARAVPGLVRLMTGF